MRRPVVCGLLHGVAVWPFMNLPVLPLSSFPHKTTPQPFSVAVGRFSNHANVS
ncbi:MAG TPA: hypothetical protein VEQ42_04765 [Pyrinomonadaceae bacterium]|nr:hypothetical protein [Pyrinomonadaceae bacterium]